MNRILHVIGKRPTGGIGTVVKNYQSNIDRDIINFDYLIFNDELTGDFDEYVKGLGSKVYVFPELRNSRFFMLDKKIKDFFEEYGKEYKIVHLHSINIGFMVLKYAEKTGIKVRIVHSHATEYSDKKLNAIRNFFLYKVSMKYATDYFYCSREAGKFLYGDRKEHTFEMYNAINPMRYAYNQADRKIKRNELGIDDNKVVLINTGRFNEQKNHLFLIDVAKELKQMSFEFILLLVGDGSLREEINRKINGNNLTEEVKILGYRNDIPELLSCSDLFVLPSLYEGLPLSVVEAECNGLSCIISSNVTTEIDFNNSTCHFLDISDKASASIWAKKICSLDAVINRDEAYRLADKNHFNIKTEAKRVTEKYMNLLATAYKK